MRCALCDETDRRGDFPHGHLHYRGNWVPGSRDPVDRDLRARMVMEHAGWVMRMRPLPAPDGGERANDER
jgi:hypothetical protein